MELATVVVARLPFLFILFGRIYRQVWRFSRLCRRSSPRADGCSLPLAQTTHRTRNMAAKFLCTIFVALLVPQLASANSPRYALTIENAAQKGDLGLFYMESMSTEYKIGSVSPRKDMSQSVAAGQPFAVRSPSGDFRMMLLIEKPEAVDSHMVLMFVNQMGESSTKHAEIKYDKKVVGTSKVNEPHMEAAFDHSRFEVSVGGKPVFAVRAVRLDEKEL